MRKVFKILLAVVVCLSGSLSMMYAEDTEVALDVENCDFDFLEDDSIIILRCGESVAGDIIIPEAYEGFPVTAIGEFAFADCSDITSVTIPESVSYIGDGAFSGCESLENIYVSDGNLHFASINGILYSSDETLLYSYPAGKEELNFIVPDNVERICCGAFWGCGYLESIGIPESVEFIEDEFRSCDSLRAISVNEENEIYCSADGVLCLKDGSAVIKYPPAKVGTSYTILSGTEKVFPFAFEESSFLGSITVPASVTRIEEGAFSNCFGLTEVYYELGVAEWNEIFIADGNEYLKDADINYYYGDASNDEAYTETELIADGTYRITPYNVPVGSSIIFACYSDDKLVYSEEFTNDNNMKTVNVSDVLYDEIKVFVWEGLDTLVPVCEYEPVNQ